MNNVTSNLQPSLADQGEIVNDMHSQLNQTTVKHRLTPANAAELRCAIKSAGATNNRVCVAGGRHAMGAQQFLQQGILVDTNAMKNILDFDQERGLIEVESGILWPDLIAYLKRTQTAGKPQWSIAQKQTGCDRLSIGGALSANIHGRALTKPPFIDDIENFTIVMTEGETIRCSRREHYDLFKLAIGGYGLFGIAASATLRLVRKSVLRRSVEVTDAAEVISKLDTLSKHGATYGDFQFAIDNKSNDFLRRGILSAYTPVETANSTRNKMLSLEDWHQLLHLAHTDKAAAFHSYSKYYLSTDGQLYDSDVFQLATYVDNYHRSLNHLPGLSGTELISELYVPRCDLAHFLGEAANLLRDQGANVIYGTVRLIERDTESYLAWATQSWACVVLNLHVEHSPHGIASASRSFTSLIDLAIKFGGSYYLTYHRFASRHQLLSCYPQLPEFLKLKLKYDPNALFASDWYDHCQKLVAAG